MSTNEANEDYTDTLHKAIISCFMLIETSQWEKDPDCAFVNYFNYPLASQRIKCNMIFSCKISEWEA